MNKLMLVVTSALTLMALPVANSYAIVECFEPPRGQPAAAADDDISCSSAVTGHVATSFVDTVTNELALSLSEGVGNARATSIGFDADGRTTAALTLIEPGLDTDVGQATIVAHDVQLITEE